jgi:hypothetical protein
MFGKLAASPGVTRLLSEEMVRQSIGGDGHGHTERNSVPRGCFRHMANGQVTSRWSRDLLNFQSIATCHRKPRVILTDRSRIGIVKPIPGDVRGNWAHFPSLLLFVKGFFSMTVISIRSRGLLLAVTFVLGCAVGCEGEKSTSAPPPPSGTAPPAPTTSDKPVKGGPISDPAYDSARGAKPK